MINFQQILQEFEKEFPSASPRAGEGLGPLAGVGMTIQYEEDKRLFRAFLKQACEKSAKAVMIFPQPAADWELGWASAEKAQARAYNNFFNL